MSSEETITTIAKALGEADEGPLLQIKAVVDNLGAEACVTLLAETEKIEKAGGLTRGDGTGRRSPGGVFFFLARQRLPRDVRAAIFNDKRPRDPHAPGEEPAQAKKAPPPPAPRRRVFEVVPASKPASSRTPLEPRGPWPPPVPEGAHIPAELADAAARAKVKQAAHGALASLNPSDQYLILLDMLGELHAQYGGEVPRPSLELPRSERKPTGLSQPPAAANADEDEPTPSPAPTKTSRARAAPKTAKAASKARSRA
ncbi:MAG TPA: phosphorylated adapter RNA export RNA-binding domain-containing protein [Polyangiaceae bacterium]|jgi:hypothetical protein